MSFQQRVNKTMADRGLAVLRTRDGVLFVHPSGFLFLSTPQLERVRIGKSLKRAEEAIFPGDILLVTWLSMSVTALFPVEVRLGLRYQDPYEQYASTDAPLAEYKELEPVTVGDTDGHFKIPVSAFIPALSRAIRAPATYDTALDAVDKALASIYTGAEETRRKTKLEAARMPTSFNGWETNVTKIILEYVGAWTRAGTKWVELAARAGASKKTKRMKL